MADLITRLKLQNGDFNAPLEESKKKVSEFQDKTEDASKTIDDLGKKGSKSTKELLSQMKEIDKGTRSISNYRRQLADIQKQIADLTINYRNMNAEMQNSSIGQEVAAKIQELTQQAANYKDAILDSQNAIKVLASDTAVWDSMKMGIETASAALQGFVSLGVLGANSTEKLVAVIAKLKSIEAATNAVIKIGTALQKDSALMMGIARLQSAALTKAKIAEAAATGKATLAMKAMNLVAKANPYVLLATTILTLVGAVAAYTLATKKNNSETERAKRIQEAYNKKLDEAKVSAGDSIAKFNLLCTEYKSLRTEAEKTEWIEDNKDKFSELGISLDNINDAQKILIDRAQDYIRVLTLEAEAAALMEYYTEEYKKGIEDIVKAQNKATNAGNDFWGLTAKEIKKYGLEEGKDYTKEIIPGSTSPTGITVPAQVTYHLTADGQSKLEKEGVKAGESIQQGIETSLSPVADLILSKQTEAASIRKDLGQGKKQTNNNNNTPNNKKELKAAEDSLKRQEEILGQMKEKYEAMSKSDPGFSKAKKEYEDQLKLVEELRKEYELTQEPVASQLQQLNDQKKVLEENLSKLPELSEEWKNQLQEIIKVEKKIKDLETAVSNYRKRLENPIEPIQMPVNPIIGKAETKETLKIPMTLDQKSELFSQAQDAVAKIQNYLDLGLIGREQAQNFVDNVNKTLASENIQATVSLDFDIKSTSDILNEYVDSFDNLSSIANGTVGSINSIYDSISSLSDKLAESENAWESFFAVFQTGMTVFQSFTSIVEAISKATELMNITTTAGIGLKNQDTNATQSNAEAHITNAAAIGAEASAAAGESVAGIPIAGPALAVAAIATVLAAIMSALSSAKKFAGGGIVPGNMKFGDNVIAKVNSGEMILNTKQQKNLFKIIDQGRVDNRLTSGEVNFKIKGSDLIGTLSNYQNKRNKI